MELGRVGLWTFALRSLEGERLAEVVGELEELGYGAIWFPGGPAASAIDHATALLDASSHIAVASGIISIWAAEAADLAARNAALVEKHPSRFALGLGVSHPEALNRREPGRYQHPFQAMRSYLDELDTIAAGAGGDGAKNQRVLAALGPKMLDLAATRAAGAHPYFVPVEHTAVARQALGRGPLLAPEQAVVLETDPEAARAAARLHMAGYLRLTNYVSNLRRLGYTDDDVSGPSDRLVDAVVAWGDEAAIAARLRDHYDAGADHVCIQVLPMTVENFREVPLDGWRRLAPALTAPRSGT